MSAAAAVFRAVGDPTRRSILDLLANGECTVSELVARFGVSQPAISQHLKVLRSAGLVSQRREGRLRHYRLEPAPLREVYDWVAHYERFWDDKLSALGTYLDETGPSPDQDDQKHDGGKDGGKA